MRLRSILAAALAAGCLLRAPGHAAERLSSGVSPVFQAVHLRADADSTRYTGWMKADLDVRTPGNRITLHAEGQTLESIALTQGGKSIAVKASRGDQGLLVLTAARPLARGAASLEIRFSNPYNTQAVGLYSVRRGEQGYLFTQFEANEARKAFPCWDEPGFKIPYQITLEIPASQQAITNTPVERESARDGWKTIAFAKTPPMPSYLLAMCVGRLEFVDVPGTHVPTRVVTVQGQSQLAGLAVKTAPPVIAALESYFGMPYPYAKLDLVAVPEYWYGAMENPGAITFTESSLLLDPASVSTQSRRTLTRFLAHELAHMWFGDYVTMAWWDDLWLNESFADWMGDKISEQVAPQFQLQLGEVAQVQEIMETDARPSTDPIRNPSADGNESMRSVGLAYYKGKAVLAMFEQWIGPEVFRKGINEYLRAHAWKNAVAGDLWAALSQVSGKDVTAAMAGYIEQQGLPLLSVEPVPGGHLRITQRRFLHHGVQADPLMWKVPVGLRWSDGSQVRTQRVLLDGSSTTLTLEGGGKPLWIMPNADGRGYYRWTVPQDMMLALSRDAASRMNPAERIAFLGNAAALLEGGELRGDAYLRLLSDFADDPDPLVAAAVLGGLANVKGSFVPDDLRDPFAAFVRKTLSPMARRFGLEKKAGEPEVVSLFRPQLLDWMADEGQDPQALGLADQMAARYLADPTSVDASLAGTALQLRAMHGDRVLFEAYRKAFEASKTPSDRQRYLGALGRFVDPAIQDEALRYALEGPVRVNEIRVITAGIRGQSDAGRDRAFAWLRQHYAQVSAKIPSEFQAGFPNYAGGCSRERLDLARQFFAEPAHRVPGTEKELSQVGEEVGDCAGLREREGPAVAAFLRALAAGSGARTARGSAP
jgi:alanyl aminopeptidase